MINGPLFGGLQYVGKKPRRNKACFRHRTFHELNLMTNQRWLSCETSLKKQNSNHRVVELDSIFRKKPRLSNSRKDLIFNKFNTISFSSQLIKNRINFEMLFSLSYSEHLAFFTLYLSSHSKPTSLLIQE